MPIKHSPKLAVFDLDHTVLSIDSEEYWSQFLFKKKVVDQTYLDRIKAYYRDYENGTLNIHEYQAYFNQPLLNTPLEKILSLRAKYLNKIKKAIHPRIHKRVKHFRRNDFHILLITATNSFLAQPIAEKVGIPNLICTQLKTLPDGTLTNQIEGTPAFKEGKIELLHQWLSAQGINFTETWAYSDSHNDIPLLQWAQKPVAAYPDPILRKHALQNGWKIIEDAPPK